LKTCVASTGGVAHASLMQEDSADDTAAEAKEDAHQNPATMDAIGTGAGQLGTILDSNGKGSVQIQDGNGKGGFGHNFAHATTENGYQYGMKGDISSHSSYHSRSDKSNWTKSYAHSSGTYHSLGNIGSNCSYQIQIMQVVYIKAWLQITRLVAEYEWLIHSTSCPDYVKEVMVTKERRIKEKIEKITVKVTSWEQKLISFRARISTAYRAEAKLRIHIQQLSFKCQSMSATVSSLDHVRDAIHILGACPGLGRITFITPSWEGGYATVSIDPSTYDDQTIDLELERVCKAENASWRAVETSELMLKTVTGLPQVNTNIDQANPGNTQGLSLLGTCPNCNGDEDEDDVDILGNKIPNVAKHKSGHLRVCWREDKPLDTQSRSTDCGANSNTQFLVLCVDAHDSAWTGITNWEGIKAYSHSATFGHSYYSHYMGSGKGKA